MRHVEKMTQTETDTETLQPDETGALKETIAEFVKRLTALDNELAELKESRKDLLDEFRKKLDMKTMMVALRIVKLESNIEHKSTYDTFKDILDELKITV